MREDKGKGLKCPQCGNRKSRVLWVRDYANGKRARRRQCCECKRRFSTLEGA